MFFDPQADYEAVFSPSEARLEELTARGRELYRSDPERFAAAWKIAVGARNVASLIAFGRALEAEQALGDAEQLIYAEALVPDRRYMEAHALLKRPIGQATRARQYWITRARALAAICRFEDATTVVAKAKARGASPRAYAEMEEALSVASALYGRPPGKLGRKGVARLVAALATLGAREAAAKAARGAIRIPAAEPERVLPSLMLLTAALEVLEPAELEAEVRGLLAAHPQDSGARALALEWAARAGRFDEALQWAAAVGPEDRRSLRRAAARAVYAAGELEQAVGLLGALATENENDLDNMSELARCVGDQVIRETGLTVARSGPRKVINLVMFNNEYTLTQMRMDEMASWVDHFVFVEAGETFTGKPKPMRFDECKPLIAPYADKISHIRIERFPAYIKDAWARELYQRDMGIAGLKGLCSADDVVMVTDADEIVDRRALAYFDGPLASMRMTMFKFFLNYRADQSNKMHSNRAGAICRAELLTRFGASYLRSGLSRYQKSWHILPAAGWHFTGINTAEVVAQKMASYSHQGPSKQIMHNPAYIQTLIDRIRSGEPEAGWGRVGLGKQLPRYILKHREQLQDFLL